MKILWSCTKMNRLKVGLTISFFLFASTVLGKDDRADIVIEKSLEIFGSEERPRIVFIIPEYKPAFKNFEIDRAFFIRQEMLLEKDIKNNMEKD